MSTNQNTHAVEIPIGFTFALALNQPAMEYFSSLSDTGKHQVIGHVHTIQSKKEMRSFVDSLGKASDMY